MLVEPMPILLDLPGELLGERVLIRPPRPGDGAAVWEAVEESREQIAPWLPWMAKTLGPDDCEAAARRGAARWQTREDLMASVWERATGRYLGGACPLLLSRGRPSARPELLPHPAVAGRVGEDRRGRGGRDVGERGQEQGPYAL